MLMLIMCTGSPLKTLHFAGKGPLYMQYEGHSRTIVGIEKVFRAGSQSPTVAFLILDPSTRTGPLDRALRERKGWQVRLQCHLHPFRAYTLRLVLIDQARSHENAALCTMFPAAQNITNRFSSPPRALLSHI